MSWKQFELENEVWNRAQQKLKDAAAYCNGLALHMDVLLLSVRNFATRLHGFGSLRRSDLADNRKYLPGLLAFGTSHPGERAAL